ncbi:MAG: response regulator transcription factor [Dehalococcoidia bacterium]
MLDFPQRPADSDDDRDSSVANYARKLQEAARDLRTSRGSEEWRRVVNDGLKAAYLRKDSVGVAAMVQVIVSLLDAQGRFGDAVLEIDGALALARSDRRAAAVLHAMKANYLVVMGRVGEARTAVSEVDDLCASLEKEIRGKPVAMAAAARLLMLEEVDAGEVADLLALDSEVPEPDRLFLLSSFVPFLAATGGIRSSRVWARTLRLEASSAGHMYRDSDAICFAAAERSVVEPRFVPDVNGITERNVLAWWRIHALRLRALLLRRDFKAAREQLALVLGASSRAGTPTSTLEVFDALVSAYEGSVGAESVGDPPSAVHLNSVSVALAGMEAAAVSGTQTTATRWLAWAEDSLPASVQTSLEWPVSRLRVQGLLALRAGDVRRARHLLEQAVEWAIQSGYAVERSIGQIQLAELLRRHSSATRERTWTSLRKEGWHALQQLEIDPAVHAYFVAGPSNGWEATSHLVGRLTRREVEVLTLLAEGYSYKDVAARLGVKWPTVQALAHRCYQKLDASGKAKAVKVAREMGIL